MKIKEIIELKSSVLRLVEAGEKKAKTTIKMENDAKKKLLKDCNLMIKVKKKKSKKWKNGYNIDISKVEETKKTI